MKYISLLQWFYQDRNKYRELCDSRSHGDNTIALPFKIKEQPAFYLLTSEIHHASLSIYKTNSKVKEVLSLLPRIAINQFCRRCLIDEIVLTNEIEGVSSTRKDISNILDGLHNNDRRHRFEGLVLKYEKLQSKEKIPLDTCQDIRNLYNELVLDEIMENDPDNKPDGIIFRKGPVSVVSPTQKELHQGLLPESTIISALEQGLRFIHDESYDILIRIAVFHYYWGYIHPFYDGNGRLSRFISSYLLAQELEPVIAYRISYTIKESMHDYYEAFKICNDARNFGDITPFVTVFLNILDNSMQQLLKGLEERYFALHHYYQVLKKKWSDSTGNYTTIERLLFYLIQGELFSENGIPTSILTSVLNCSRTTFDKYIKELEPLQLLKKEKIGRTNYYSVDLNRLDALAEKWEKEA